MARKDRERARRRHAVDRSRREQGIEPPPKRRSGNGKPVSGAATRAAGARPGAGEGPRRRPFQQAKAGDLDSRGRVRERDMLVDPKITLVVIIASLGFVAASLFVFRNVRWLPYLGFSIAMLGYADLSYRKRHALYWVTGAGVMAALAVNLAVTGK